MLQSNEDPGAIGGQPFGMEEPLGSPEVDESERRVLGGDRDRARQTLPAIVHLVAGVDQRQRFARPQHRVELGRRDEPDAGALEGRTPVGSDRGAADERHQRQEHCEARPANADATGHCWHGGIASGAGKASGGVKIAT